MAGTVTIVETASPTTHLSVRNRFQSLRRIKWSWTSDASGDATHTTAELYSGIVAALTTDPGTPAPTALYDIAIVCDADITSFGIIGASGVNLSATVTATVIDDANFRYFGPGVISVAVSNAGDSKQGVVYLWVKQP